ncbi:hypothetical protein BGY98DRAFT_1092311 [Russula aff. rugulosa BPL654]|nr:hypothetical protein BGY98DRAFT_1092311 [Russula aff. rugulosa BPL654]
MNPASNPRGRARNASKTPYGGRVNAIKNLHPILREIIEDCPAVDTIFDNHTRRRSTHNRARDEGHVRRPPNAFMVYRSYVYHTKKLENNDEKNLSAVSRQAGRSWQVMGEQAQHPFKQVADIAKREHAARNPNYKYSPSSRSQTSPKKPARRASKAKVKAKVKVKESATHRNAGRDSLPLLKEATPTPACTPRASSDLSSSSPSSSPSPYPPSTPPTPMPRQWALNLPPSSPELRYPRDRDHTDCPPQPCVRPVTSGLIPSPSMSVLQLNDAHTPSILHEMPDKYKEAESYHDLQPHALLPNQGIPFDGAEPNTQISGRPAPAETIDYSSYISGNPEVNLGSPIPNPSANGWCFPGPSNTTTNNDLNSSTTLNWSVFDMPTLDFDGIVDEPSMYGLQDDDLFDAVITYEDY